MILCNNIGVEIPSVTSYSWLDNPKYRVKIPDDGKLRPSKAHLDIIAIHTTRGIDKPVIINGPAPDIHCNGRKLPAYWSGSKRVAAAHLVGDSDGSIICIADLVREVTYHCPNINNRSVGYEVVQLPDGRIYQNALDTLLKTCKFLSDFLEIPKIVTWPYTGQRDLSDFRGFCGHRDANDGRDAGDPSDTVLGILVANGWKGV